MRFVLFGTGYGHFNDSRCERVSWETVASRHTQISVTVLVYARSKFASADDRSGGTAEVPYKRGFQTSECAPPLIPVGVVLFMHFSVNSFITCLSQVVLSDSSSDAERSGD